MIKKNTHTSLQIIKPPCCIAKKWESVLFSGFVKGEWQLHNKDETFVGLNYCLAPRCQKQSVKKISSTLKVGGFRINFGCLVKFKMLGVLLLWKCLSKDTGSIITVMLCLQDSSSTIRITENKGKLNQVNCRSPRTTVKSSMGIVRYMYQTRIIMGWISKLGARCY